MSSAVKLAASAPNRLIESKRRRNARERHMPWLAAHPSGSAWPIAGANWGVAEWPRAAGSVHGHSDSAGQTGSSLCLALPSFSSVFGSGSLSLGSSSLGGGPNLSRAAGPPRRGGGHPSHGRSITLLMLIIKRRADWCTGLKRRRQISLGTCHV